jgi:hypothetical protein
MEDIFEVAAEKDKQEILCKNCENRFSGNYCPQCGQSVKDYDKPFRFIIIDFMGNLFAFDTRLWNTLKNMLFRPGKIEQDYSEGKRARYMPPFRLYVFISFIFFLMITWISENNIRNGTDKGFSFNVGRNQELTDEQIEKLPEVARQKLAERKTRNNSDSEYADIHAASIPGVSPNGLIRTDLQEIIDNREKYTNRLIKYFSWSLFLLMPFYGFLLWLFFRKSRPFYMTHLNMAINYHVFIFLIMTLLTLIQIVLPEKRFEPENYLGYLIPVYAIAGARKIFNQGWIRTVWRMFLVNMIYIMVLLAMLVLLVFLTFLR